MSRTSINDFLGGGLGPLPLSAPFVGGGLVAFPVESFTTPLLDLTQVALGIELAPAKPGHYAVPIGNMFIVVESKSGTQTTPPTTRSGSNAAHTNSFPQISTRPANADVAAVAVPGFILGPAAAAAGVQQIANAPVIFDLVSGALGAGGFSLFARFVGRFYWVPVL
jgi:hypothetical protein